jgi:hypothetical protein
MNKTYEKGKRKLPPKAEIGSTYNIKRKVKGKWRVLGMKATWKFVSNKEAPKKPKKVKP